MTARYLSRIARAAGVAALLATAACGGESLGTTDGDSGNDDSIKVGLLVAQSGVYSSVGGDMEDGFRLFLEDNEDMFGGREVEVVTVDEGDTPQSGVAAATRLVQQEQVDVVVGIVTSPTAMGSRDIFDSAGVPVLMGNTGAVALGGELASDWIWRASYDNGDPGRALGAHLADEEKAGDVFLVAPDYAGGHEAIDGFKETFPADRIAGELYPPFGTTSDYSSYLSQIRVSGADTVFCFFAGGEAIEFTKQFAGFGLSDSVDLYSAGFLTDGATLEAEGKAALGVRNASRYNWDLDNAANKVFAPAYEAKYGRLPTIPAATMYDIGVILDAAVAAIDGDVTRESLNEAIGGLSTLEGVRGDLEFDDNRTMIAANYLTEVQQTDDGLRNITIDTLPAP
jgi:branched-chain amino acid transport system substrate-binding protein